MREIHKYIYMYIHPPQFHGAHKSEISWMCDGHFVFMDSSAHQSLQQEGCLSLRGSLTELDLDLPVFILGFYLSLWGNTSLVYKMQILLTILYKV